MFKALIRYLLLSTVGFVDGLIIIIFDKVEIQRLNTVFSVKPIEKNPTEEQKILIKYLERCRKETFEGTNGAKNTEKRAKKRSEKETDT